MSHGAKRLSITMYLFATLWSPPLLLANGVVTYSGCDLDMDADSCSPEEISAGGQIEAAEYVFREDSAGSYIGSAFNDGADFPDFHLPKVTASSSRHLLTIRHDDQQQIRANNLHAGGNTFSFVNFHFDLDIPPDETIYGFLLRLTPAVLTGSCGSLRTTFEMAAVELALDLESTSPTATRFAQTVLLAPIDGGDTGTTAGGDLFLRANITGCELFGEGFEAAHHGTVSIRLLLSPPAIFADGFESGDATLWSSSIP